MCQCPPSSPSKKSRKRFGAVVVADNIDLTLLRGEALGIIGPNGAGKTTLFGIVTGTVPPDSGRVMFEGHDVTRMTPERRCRMGIARSFQIPQPFGGMTVFENLVVAAAFGGGRSERDVYAGCAGLLERCGLADKANRQAGALTAARPQAPGAGPRARHRAARAAARRGRRRPGRARDGGAGRSDQRRARRPASRSSGSSTSSMR